MTDPKHIDAVARTMCRLERPCYQCCDGAKRLMTAVGGGDEQVKPATPEVYAAMLDALTRHGVLESTEDYGVRREWGDVGSVAPQRGHAEAAAVAKAWKGTVVTRRRLVTRWEVAP